MGATGVNSSFVNEEQVQAWGAAWEYTGAAAVEFTARNPAAEHAPSNPAKNIKRVSRVMFLLLIQPMGLSA
jgi:hypothetical protein